MSVPVPVVVPKSDWQLLTGDALSPYSGSSTGIVITAPSFAPILVPNQAFFMTAIVNKTPPGSPTFLVLESDNLALWQEFTVIDGALDAGTNPITVTATGLSFDGAPTRVLSVNGAAETYQWDGTQFRVKSRGAP